MAHINSIIPDTLDPLQFAYRPNRSIDIAISSALHTALTHLDKRNTYVKMLLMNYSSAFNTIVITKLRTLGINPFLCNWILNFLTGRPQVVRVVNITSAMLTHNMWAPKGAGLVPSCTPCSPTTAWPCMMPTPSSSLMMTQGGRPDHR
jgi:hypothetical protein